MKHRVMLTLDAVQLRLLHEGLRKLLDLLDEGAKDDLNTGDDPVYFGLCSILIAAREVCENRDRADEAERKLSQLAARSVTVTQ